MLTRRRGLCDTRRCRHNLLLRRLPHHDTRSPADKAGHGYHQGRPLRKTFFSVNCGGLKLVRKYCVTQPLVFDPELILS